VFARERVVEKREFIDEKRVEILSALEKALTV
jgi:hypothetical protein